jgi:hypothetical protein
MGDTGDSGATKSTSRSTELLKGAPEAPQPNALQEQAANLLVTHQPGDRIENVLRANGLVAPRATEEPKQRTALDSLVENNRVARLGLVTAEGAAYAVPGVFNGMIHDITHPVQAVEKGTTALALGVAMRVALPKAGAARAAAATAFTYFMVRDAAVPVGKAFSDVWDAKDHAQVNLAAQKMGDGLGMFAWDAYWGMKIATHGERLGEKGMQGILGEKRFNAFENAKGEFLGSDKYFFGRQVNRFGEAVDKGTQTLADKLLGKRKSNQPELTFEQKMAKAEEAHGHHELMKGSQTVHKHGVRTTDGQDVGFDQTISIFLSGKDPRKMTSAQISEALKTEEVRLSSGTPEVPGAKPAETVTGAKPTDAAAKPTDIKGSTPELAAKVADDLNPKNIAELAKMAKEEMGKLSDEQQQVVDLVEGSVGPVHAALNPNHKALDPGYKEWLTQMIALSNEVGGDVQKLQQVAPLFFRGRDAAIGQMSTDLGPTGRNVHSLNLFSLEMYTGLKQRMNKAGVPADEVLSAKNPPLNLVARDNGAGPHTIPEIQGVWDVDLVHWPRNMQDLRILRAGINGHENKHDQFGGILKFAESIREQVIGETVAKALGSKATEMVDVPGHGKMSKQDLIVNILKAQANENTADIGGAAHVGPNGGMALGILLQGLRQGGQLETRNVYGKEMASAENPMGIEVHAIDVFRPKLVAEVLRQRSNGDPMLLEYAKQLDAYAETASRGGKDYVWASTDTPGQKIVIPRAELDAVIPHLVSAQLNTPLEALKGKTYAEILPNLPVEMKKMDGLADLMVDAVANKKPLESIPFNTQDYTMIQLQGAALPAAMRLMAKGGRTAAEVNAEINRVSDFLELQFHKNGDPHISPLVTNPSIKQIALNPALAARQAGRGLGHTINGIRDFSGRDRLIYGYGGMAIGSDMFSTYVPGSQAQALVNEGRKQAGAGVAPVEAPAAASPDSERDASGKIIDRPIDKVVIPPGQDINSGRQRTLPRVEDPFLKGTGGQKPSTIDYNELRRMQKQGDGFLKR